MPLRYHKGDAFGFIYNGEEYYYIKNVQNDIVAIADKNGTVVANYYYDAWGNVTQITGNTALAQTNPLRYRSYYYDSETGFYYVSSRYYYPEVGRWISPEPNVDYGEFDDGSEILGYNVYAYCFNNPVNNFDPTGEFVISTAVLIGIGIGALIGGVAGGGGTTEVLKDVGSMYLVKSVKSWLKTALIWRLILHRRLPKTVD